MQENGATSIGDAFHTAFGVPKPAVGVVVAAVAGFIFLGSVKRIASVTEKLVPIMACFYIVGWYFFGEVNVKAMFGKGAVKGYAVIVVFFVVLGSFLKVDLVWNLSDLFNALMVFPNLIALLALSGVVARESRGERLR